MPEKKNLKNNFKRKKSSSGKSDAHHSSSAKKIFLSSLFGAAGGIVIMLGLILLFAALALFFDYPHVFLTPLTLFALGAAAFFGGFIATRKNGGTALLCGVLSGALLLLVLKAIRMLLPIAQDGLAAALTEKLILLCMLPVAALGAFLGVPQSKNKSKYKG